MNARMHLVATCAVCSIVAITLIGSARAAGPFVVRYRLEKWKAAHFKDEAAAKKFMGTLTKLECESKKHAHDGHIDVSYRCTKWRELKTDTDKLAHEWERWLRDHGFETLHRD